MSHQICRVSSKKLTVVEHLLKRRLFSGSCSWASRPAEMAPYVCGEQPKMINVQHPTGPMSSRASSVFTPSSCIFLAALLRGRLPMSLF